MVNSRTKGRTGEQDVVNIFKKQGILVSRNLMQSMKGGFDLITVGTVLSKYAIEIKRTATISPGKVKDWRQQALRQAKTKIPLLIWRQDYGLWMVEYTDQRGYPVTEFLKEWIEREGYL